MEKTLLVGPDDASRGGVVAFMRRSFAENYNAELTSFPDILLCRRDRTGEILCAAGLRTAKDGFFSELYLDQPIERKLAHLVGHRIERSTICEVTGLASQAPQETSGFIDDTVATIADLGFRWSFYTLTRRLSRLLRHKGLSPLDLAPADPSRVPFPERWGSYYLSAPRVFAISADLLPPRYALSGDPVPHAQIS